MELCFARQREGFTVTFLFTNAPARDGRWQRLLKKKKEEEREKSNSKYS